MPPMSEHVRELLNMGEVRVVLVDSITQVIADDDGSIIVTGSHGGLSSGRYAASVRAKLYAFNDAGGGKDGAGMAALPLLEKQGTAALCVSHNSARIGDAHDTFRHGIIAVVNGTARSLGFEPDKSLQTSLAVLGRS